MDDLDAKSAALESLRLAWEAEIAPIVADKLADAHAHALSALTRVLKDTADGRSSLLQINRSPSFAAANHRIDELAASLAGPSEVSLQGMIRDAREAFLRLACNLWHPLIPVEFRSRDDHPPTDHEVKMIRAAAIHGYDPRQVLLGPVGNAKRNLKAALEQAGRRSTPGHVEDEILADWQRRATASIGQTVKLLLSDSAEYADRMAGRGLIDAKFLDDTPVADRIGV